MSLIRRTVILVGLLSLGLISIVQAQTDTDTLETLAIDLWPDYDRTAVLVLMTGSLPADVPLPASVSIPLPDNADLNVVARITDAAEMIDDVDAFVRDGEVVFVTPDRRFRVEYYVPYTEAGDERQFDFSWLADLSVNQLEIAVQQPTAATSLQTDPLTTNVGQDPNDGFIYHILPALSVPAGTPYEVGVTYTMETPTLSANESAPPPNAAPPTAVDESRVDWPLMLAGVGLGLILAAIVWQVVSSRQNKKKRPRKVVSKPKSVKTATSAKANFCHECGAKLQASDKFCRECGTAVKQK